MTALIAYLLGIFITFPALLTVVVYLVARNIYRSKWKAVHFTVNVTTLFYIIAVGTLLHSIFGHTYFGFIFIMLVVILGTFLVMQWKLNSEIIFKHAWKKFWRVSFLLFVFAYVGLTVYGIIQRIIA